ncbi:MAG: DUF2333 family protein [Pseudomonadota bacterium]
MSMSGFLERLRSRGGSPARIGAVAAAAVGVYLLIVVLLGWWWDYEPATFDVNEHAAAHAEEHERPLVIGYTTTATVLRLARTLLDKRGGYLSNDLFPPGVWMDNVPHWEFGVLTQLRDVARAYRMDFSRSQSQSTEDRHLSVAEGKFFFDNSSWAFPPSESEYRDGIELFERYLTRLAEPGQTDAQFYARADNLRQWLQGVETRLGSLSQRLSASVGKRRLDVNIPELSADGLEDASLEESGRTPWLAIDDVFYEARGQTWALLHLLKAMEQDFGDVLDKKNARVSLQQIIRELESTQETIWSPVILNGDGLGVLANHSLVMASYVSRANAGLSDLRMLLAQG